MPNSDGGGYHKGNVVARGAKLNRTVGKRSFPAMAANEGFKDAAEALLACAKAAEIPFTKEEAMAEALQAERFGCKTWTTGIRRMQGYKPTAAYVRLRAGLMEKRKLEQHLI
eukprot:607363-Pelagomonas_calceolata.AAC.1